MIHHSYWEDALGAYNPSANNLMLTTAEEAEFIKNIEDILEAAYNLQDASEMLFIHQNSVLNKRELSLEVGAEISLEVRHGRPCLHLPLALHHPAPMVPFTQASLLLRMIIY